jgi:hypothetical protein
LSHLDIKSRNFSDVSKTVPSAAGQARHDVRVIDGKDKVGMKVYRVNGNDYRLSNTLTSFQREMQVHLVNWKWANITHEAGLHNGQPNDAILPELFVSRYPMLYPAILPTFKQHKQDFHFRLHQYFNHVASSQIANVNLFLPVLLHTNANVILRELNPDFARLAPAELDHGYRLEFWDEPYGTLGDRTPISGTDADIAIAYYNHENQLCLWLIEHKLTENEFTTCGGSRSKGRTALHSCGKSFSAILEDKATCYYHSANRYNFWNITEEHQTFFVNHARYAQCPFRGGLNQLWRNQLLALSVEQDEHQPYRHVTFSVVKHPRNKALDKSLTMYMNLVADNPKFSVFTSKNVLDAAAGLQDPELDRWIAWYRELYAL